jgi:hypothetical protein
MNLGAERKKVAMLGGLGLLAAYSIYTNVLSGPDIPPEARQARPAAAPSTSQPTALDAPTQRRLDQRKKMIGGRQSPTEQRYTMNFTKDNRPDPMKVDPTLRLELLAKLQSVTLEGGHRSLFEIGAAPPPPTADVPKIVPGAPVVPPRRLATAMLFPGPKPPDPPKPVPPPPPPITLKFYGFTTPKAGGIKRAFFLDGEDIHVVSEGDTIKTRYKIIRIGVNSAVVEDTQHKHQQTLQLEEPPISG